jgi:hypothetical protein
LFVRSRRTLERVISAILLRHLQSEVVLAGTARARRHLAENRMSDRALGWFHAEGIPLTEWTEGRQVTVH